MTLPPKHIAAILFGLGSITPACDSNPHRDFTGPNSTAEKLDPELRLANTWAAKRPTPAARLSMQAGTIDSFIYVVGGVGNSVTTRRVERYNVLRNLWSSGTALPSARAGLNGASSINRRLYVTGGLNSSGTPTRTLYVLDPATGSWLRRADMPQAGCCGGQGVIGGQLYVYTVRGSTAHGFFRYNPANNQWVTRALPPSRHAGPAAGAIGGKFYLAGGTRNGFTANVALHVYDPATNSWSTRAPLPMGQARMASAVIGGKLYAAGGVNAGQTMDTLRVFDPATNAWTKKAPMPTERTDPAGAAANGLFFVIGGVTSIGDTTTKVEAYTP